MTNPKTFLNEALGDFYTKHVMKGHPTNEAAAKLMIAVMDPDIKEEARQRKEQLEQLDSSCNGNLAKRCFVSHVQLTGLREVFNER